MALPLSCFLSCLYGPVRGQYSEYCAAFLYISQSAVFLEPDFRT